MGTKLADFQNKISTFSTSYDILIITETWLKSEIEDAELGLESFYIFRKDRKLNTDISRGGGVLVVVRKNLGCYSARLLLKSPMN